MTAVVVVKAVAPSSSLTSDDASSGGEGQSGGRCDGLRREVFCVVNVFLHVFCVLCCVHDVLDLFLKVLMCVLDVLRLIRAEPAFLLGLVHPYRCGSKPPAPI